MRERERERERERCKKMDKQTNKLIFWAKIVFTTPESTSNMYKHEFGIFIIVLVLLLIPLYGSKGQVCAKTKKEKKGKNQVWEWFSPT